MEQTKEKQGILGTVLVISLSVVLMIVATLLLFVPQIKILYICYFICGVAIAAGIYMIVRYFMTDAFQNVNEYGFSEGVLLVILGICGMLRAQNLAASFVTILGIALSFSGIVKLQYAMDLKRMKDFMWVVALIISAVVLIWSIFVILQPFAGKGWFETVSWYTMLADGVLGLLLLGYMALRIKFYKKKELKEAQKEEQITGTVATPAADAASQTADSMFTTEPAYDIPDTNAQVQEELFEEAEPLLTEDNTTNNTQQEGN